jgi:hypothetical protein
MSDVLSRDEREHIPLEALRQGKMFTNTSKHHPNGGVVSHCDNAQLEQAIARFQGGDAGSLGEIVQLVEPRALTLIRFHKTSHYRPENELLSDVNFKLMRSIGRFDARRASAFSFVSAVITSTLQTSVTATRRNWARHSEFSDELANSLQAKVVDRSGTDDIVHRIKAGTRTMLNDERELVASRWYVTSFIDGAFELRRYQCCDAAMVVHGLSHARSRELYDLVLLSIRRLLYDDVPRREQVILGKLLGTRESWMTNYQSLMTANEFSRFFYLMAGLAPYLMLLVLDPTKANNHRCDRNPQINRKNIELILFDSPAARLLFE